MTRSLVVGLGNPGPTYAATRHNVGFMVVDLLAERSGATFKRHKAHAEIAETHLGVPPAPAVILAKPLSFMNRSGGPVSALASYFRIAPEHVIAVHDELDLPLGEIRLKLGGGDNGHNGLRSMTSSLSTKDYLRVRIGIGRPSGRQAPADYVLKPFAAVERDELAVTIERAADAVELLIRSGLAKAQNEVHGRPA